MIDGTKKATMPMFTNARNSDISTAKGTVEYFLPTFMVTTVKPLIYRILICEVVIKKGLEDFELESFPLLLLLLDDNL